jgi:hypothetical protein
MSTRMAALGQRTCTESQLLDLYDLQHMILVSGRERFERRPWRVGYRIRRCPDGVWSADE